MSNSPFRTIEVSNPVFESNHLRFITVKTPNLKGRGDICAFVPPGSELQKDIPLIILLHGVYGSCWSWTHQGGVHLKALELMEAGVILPMVIAMPSDGLWGDGSAYLQHNSFNFEKWIVEDVPNAVRQAIGCVGSNSSLFIGGLSMGGFGAMRIGAKYSSIFKGISTHSSITNLEEMSLFVEEDLTNFRQSDPVEEDVLETFLRYKNQLPPIRFDCGKDDLLIEQNRYLHHQLTLNGIPHVYEEFAGIHEWPYWQEQVSRTLQFFASI